MKKLFFALIALILSANCQAQVLSSLPDAPVSNNSHFAGVEIVGGVKTSKKYSIASLAAFIGGTQNIGNVDLTLTTNRRLNFNALGLNFFKVGWFNLTDVSGNLLLNINDTNHINTGMIYANYPNYVGFRLANNSLISLSNAGIDNLARMVTGSASLVVHQSTFVSAVTINAAGGVAQLVVDSGYKAVVVTHFGGITGTPTFTAGSGAGTGPTITITGNDLSGHITVLTGSATGVNQVIVRFFFAIPYASAPKFVTINPFNQTTNLFNAIGPQAYVDIGTVDSASFAIVSSAQLDPATTYVWSYEVHQ